ncbi:2,3-dehydroadipyl-CoA hydratase [Roseibium album]|nr:2,3-dehydroadipyl-CoA hydratase [Roseibium album]
MTAAPSDPQTERNPHLTIRGAVAELFLNAPERKNALPIAAWQRLPETIQELQKESAVRICIVRGAGGNSFCAGADISEFATIRSTPEAATRYDEINVAAFKALKALPIPAVAAIKGPCLGGGLGLALACDIRIAATSAFFGIPAAKLGLAYPPEALGDLLEAVSASNAKRLLFTGERLSASKALQIGLINEIVEEDQLDNHVNKLAETMCSNAPLSLKAAKQAVNYLVHSPDAADLSPMLQNAQNCVDSWDYREGCQAFLEKRPPQFRGS